MDDQPEITSRIHSSRLSVESGHNDPRNPFLFIRTASASNCRDIAVIYAAFLHVSLARILRLPVGGLIPRLLG